MRSSLNPARLGDPVPTVTAAQVASIILEGFDSYRREFRHITAGARKRFEDAEWLGAQDASRDRIDLYDRSTTAIMTRLAERQVETTVPLDEWKQVKAHFERKLSSRKDFVLAETVYNTVFRKSFDGQHLTDEYAFVHEPFSPEPQFEVALSRHYGPSVDLAGLLNGITQDAAFDLPWENLPGDVSLMVDAIKSAIPLLRTPHEISIEVLAPTFFRNKGAYLIGRMFVGEHVFPIAIPVQNQDGALYVDTIIWNEDDLSIIFSFTRSYFMVDTDYPNEMVHFLQELLPNKKRWELYTSIGFDKHGKTEFYRDFLKHLDESDDQFVIAEGIKGLVMAVFTLPSYQIVFKVIRDRFSPIKRVTRAQVRQAYSLVKTHDRVGRMADTQEFSQFVLPRARFAQSLLDELSSVCRSSIDITDEHVTISHLYTERLMIPLNLFIEQASDFELRQVLDEYGNAIKQLAAANIFPGDMLLKNFGVTRHHRVVFYDYDEICYLTEVNFRKIPQARYPEDEMSAEPWYSVGPRDVFPEEFEVFLFNSAKLRKMFRELHGDLYAVDYWHDIQRRIEDNQVMDVFPYRRRRRFR